MGAEVIAAELVEVNGKYVCQECGRRFTIHWIKRHMIAKHGYEYYKHNILIDPTNPLNKGRNK